MIKAERQESQRLIHLKDAALEVKEKEIADLKKQLAEVTAAAKDKEIAATQQPEEPSSHNKTGLL